jgi:hypothetical protein
MSLKDTSVKQTLSEHHLRGGPFGEVLLFLICIYVNFPAPAAQGNPCFQSVCVRAQDAAWVLGPYSQGYVNKHLLTCTVMLPANEAPHDEWRLVG